MKNIHTPGPWKIEGNKISNVRNNPDKEVLVCKIYDETINLEYQENAQLIKSAPDMYEALKFIAEGFESGNITQKHYDMVINTLETIEQSQSMSEQFIDDVNASIDKGELVLDPTFERFHPESSQIARTKFYPELPVFEVEFKSNGKIYHYANTPMELWIEAGKTESIGSFVNKQIKPYFDYRLAGEMEFTPAPKNANSAVVRTDTGGL